MNSKIDIFSDFFEYLSTDKVSIKELFEEKVKQLGVSQLQVEKALDIERKSLLPILNNEAKRVDLINLVKIANFLDISLTEIVKLFASQLPIEFVAELEKARKRTYILNNFDIKALKSSIKFFESVNDFDDIEEKILSFFKIKSIYEYENKIGIAFSKSKRNYSNKMLYFWVKSAHYYLEKINNPYEFDRNILKDLVSQIRPYTKNIENGLYIVAKALFKAGVTVIYQPYLPKTQVKGATFIINNKPCIVITDLQKNYSTIWFTLLHELYHVLFELDDIGSNVYHLTGESDLFLLDEDAANDFAREYLLPTEKAKFIYPFINDYTIVNQYASQNNIHPSIIYNFYCWDMSRKGKEYWGYHKQYLHTNYMDILNKFNSIFDAVGDSEDKIQEQFELLNA
ncbi:ImmA/IrrE family metallo-endopeptidase [Emticicia sp. W12TSBA100-4]|uniref:ImmA/IrrE family metallo-endopeptidase n=1 Tax=Emticicia sp. W12TSBA100-4 TaxID=3160965 RepID=UPI00330658CF